ncbi:hypothetical protein ACFWP2_16600 [Kitasatospora sp. NPDC058444]|uniref:hypothetical protein n=1 Tax=Kitasatospora sp. NPDC058444 TaxID=3346504 RepID=UPI003664BD46
MDSGIGAMVEAVGEARRQLRENALPKARDSSRERVPEKEEAELLKALAGLMEVFVELAAAASDRMTTIDSGTAYHQVAKRLRDQPRYLREDAAKVAKRVGGAE